MSLMVKPLILGCNCGEGVEEEGEGERRGLCCGCSAVGLIEGDGCLVCLRRWDDEEGVMMVETLIELPIEETVEGRADGNGVLLYVNSELSLSDKSNLY